MGAFWLAFLPPRQSVPSVGFPLLQNENGSFALETAWLEKFHPPSEVLLLLIYRWAAVSLETLLFAHDRPGVLKDTNAATAQTVA